MHASVRAVRARATSWCVALVVAASACDARADGDEWLGTDKAVHFELSVALASGAYGLSSLKIDSMAGRAAIGAGFSLALGASKWQTLRRIVLPEALPGIMTGAILAMARGAGEVAPLMLVGAMKLAPDLPVSSLRVMEAWGGVNTATLRPGIPDDQLAWCDGFMPLAPRWPMPGSTRSRST